MSISLCSDCGETVTRDEEGAYRESSLYRVGRPHIDCLECGKIIVCHPKGICQACDAPVHSITSNNYILSVGSCGAGYDPFEVIFDLNYPENFVHRHEYQVLFRDGKCICRFGIIDHADDAEYMQKMVGIVGNLLPSLNGRKILIHCFAGYSRSVVLAAAMLALSGDVDSVREGIERIRHSRKYVGPNDKLVEAAERGVAKFFESQTK